MGLLDEAKFLSLFSGKRGEKSPIKLLGVRGVKGDNRFSIYDDELYVWISDGADKFTLWPVSTDPSWPLVLHAINPDGAAQLCPGEHLMGKTLMHGKYPCLGQAEPVHVYRLDEDGAIKFKEAGWFGIDIHSGGRGMDTGRFSAGCQIIANRDGYFGQPTWGRFWNPIRDGMTRHKIATVPYLLIEAKSL